MFSSSHAIKIDRHNIRPFDWVGMGLQLKKMPLHIWEPEVSVIVWQHNRGYHKRGGKVMCIFHDVKGLLQMVTFHYYPLLLSRDLGSLFFIFYLVCVCVREHIKQYYAYKKQWL